MWMILLSLCVSVTLVMSLVFCLCWRKKPPKNAVTNTRRSLPDIPSEQGATVNWEPAGDNSSEHYATVGQYQNAAKRHTLTNGIESRPSISQHSSISQADDTFSPYEKVKYDKIKSKEHPYAQLQPSTVRPTVHEENQSTSEERVNLLRVEGAGTSSEPSAPPRSRRSSSHSAGGLDIPAASAVAGVLAASPELPYMTPPVTQANFSGDSQDSSKGYTSISVREPLANIIAQTKQMNKNKRELDPHYSTVSDDSDDVYTTIPDPNNPIYNSESETYARIPSLPITIEAEVNAPPSTSQEEEDEVGDELYYEPAPHPPPPSVDSLKHVTGHGSQTHSHSRQASSSSSIANLGSPKPEKRQANSPLPPPPLATSFDFHTDKLQVIRNLDDLYAKVHKNKKEELHNEKTGDISDSSENRNSLPVVLDANVVEKRLKDHNYETLKKSLRKLSDPGYEKIRNSDEPGYASINGPESITSSDPGYEVLNDEQCSELDPNYEQLRHRISNASDLAGYSRIKETVSNDGYSVVNKQRKNTVPLTVLSSDDTLDEPNYESMPSEIASEPGYAAVKSNGSESDPNYESVNQNDPNYESVKDLEEPPYERLDEDSSRTNSDLSGYEKIKKKGCETTTDTSESSNSAGKSLSDKSDPPYELLNNDTDSEIPGYEKIINKSAPNEHSSGSSGHFLGPTNSSNLLDEDGIFQV
ncbi:dentin sialophosphoprotein isoform X2 [Anoplophora glabripennis]|uniref:dentin sialophosphoprotein isoform X2 n=1 Tax=Anoplophora glabripennis TaxID=217634 RepID=UPI000C778BB1|nr:dentin sialophosphoprotein isoform X2 [Anoplophora glabripennis]